MFADLPCFNINANNEFGQVPWFDDGMTQALQRSIHVVITLLEREHVAFLWQPDNLRDMLVEVDTLAMRGLGKVKIHEVGKVGYKVLTVSAASGCLSVPEKDTEGCASISLVKHVFSHGWLEVDSAPKGQTLSTEIRAMPLGPSILGYFFHDRRVSRMLDRSDIRAVCDHTSLNTMDMWKDPRIVE